MPPGLLPGGKRTTEMSELLGRAGQTMGAHNFNTLQQELRRQRHAYGKVRIVVMHGNMAKTAPVHLKPKSHNFAKSAFQVAVIISN